MKLARATSALRAFPDFYALAFVVVAVNLPLLLGHNPADRFGFAPAAVAAGAWWRVPLHVFAHVSGYHLLLDAGAFLMLYRGLRDASCGAGLRLGAVAGGLLGSLALGSLDPGFARNGLCGLSGVAHGLMAVTGLAALGSPDRAERRVGAVTLGLVAAKSLCEALTGQVFFVEWHLGPIGRPNAYGHLGGVLGGWAAWAACAGSRTRAAAVRVEVAKREGRREDPQMAADVADGAWSRATGGGVM